MITAADIESDVLALVRNLADRGPAHGITLGPDTVLITIAATEPDLSFTLLVRTRRGVLVATHRDGFWTFECTSPNEIRLTEEGVYDGPLRPASDGFAWSVLRYVSRSITVAEDSCDTE